VKGSFHIADWEVQPQLNALKRADRSFHVEPKVMQVLVELASHSDEVLSKERLIHAVWSDTFVTEDVLTRCISEIRRVLEDDARSPRFIQTIPKTGYRLIAPVDFQAEVPAPAPAKISEAQLPPPVSRKGQPLIWILLGLLLVAGVALVWKFRAATVAPTSYSLVPFTFYPGQQTQPAFSPDGKQVAFVWNGGKGEHQHIYVKIIGSETPLRLTTEDADDFSPVWSPDARSIAFLRDMGDDHAIYVVPALGGPARRVYKTASEIEWDRGALSWSPDGKRLIFPDGKTANSPSVIFSLDLATGTAQAITTPPRLWDGDACPAFSPDGSKIAFARGVEGWVRDLYIMNSSGGDAVRVTFDGRMVASLAWTADSKGVVFSSNRAGKFSLWRVAASGGTPQRLQVGSEDAFNPSVASVGNHLAYTQSTSSWSLKRIDLHTPQAPVSSVWSSSEEDSAPRFSPSGKQIAFQSQRSGAQEIWVADSDGNNPVRLTSSEMALTGSPSWAPDGSQLAFDARPDERSHIFAVRLDGTQPKQITNGAFNDITPNWSRDGRWIYFGSNRGGSWQVWKVASTGGEPEQVTKHGGFVAVESYDAQWLYYAKWDSPGVYRMPVNGAGDEQRITDQPRSDYWGYWAVANDGIYFLNQSASPAIIEFVALNGEHRTKVATLDHTPPPYSGLTISPGGQFLLYSDRTEADSHINLVNDFR
jgi:Tol biopolymer transport system component/DNA-binding winged helix-turn-helix (wHTH) protein